MSCKTKFITHLIALAALCLSMPAIQAQISLSCASLQGNSPVTLTSCPVIIPLDSLSQIPVGQRNNLVVFVNGNEVPSQCDDTNGDNIPDEIAFLLSLHKNQPYTIQIQATTHRPDYPGQVWAEMYRKGNIGGEYRQHTAEGKTYGIKPVTQQTFYPADKSFRLMHHHGVAFESELMAYRIYFDARQTIDVYAKRHPQLELQQSLWYPDDSLLALGYGDDVLKVANTIGVGSVRPCQENKLQKIEPFTSRTQRIIANGPVRTIVEVEVNGWQPRPTSPDTLTMRVRYTLFAHHRDVFCEVFLSDTLSSLVSGVQRVGEGEYRYLNRSVASWGTDWPVNDTVKYPKETVGLAVCVPQEYYCGQVVNRHNALIRFQPSRYLCFHLTVVSQKENNPPAASSRQFWHFVKQWEKQLSREQTLRRQLLPSQHPAP